VKSKGTKDEYWFVLTGVISFVKIPGGNFHKNSFLSTGQADPLVTVFLTTAH